MSSWATSSSSEQAYEGFCSVLTCGGAPAEYCKEYYGKDAGQGGQPANDADEEAAEDEDLEGAADPAGRLCNVERSRRNYGRQARALGAQHLEGPTPEGMRKARKRR